jgi:hypothetical protein
MGYANHYIKIFLCFLIVSEANSMTPLTDEESKEIVGMDNIKLVEGADELQSQIELPKAKINIISISPASGEALSRDSVLISRIGYKVDESDLSKVKIFAQFQTNTPGVTFDGEFPDDGYVEILSKDGVVELQFPLKYVLGDERLKHPISVKFLITYQVGDGYSKEIASTKRYQYVSKI